MGNMFEGNVGVAERIISALARSDVPSSSTNSGGNTVDFGEKIAAGGDTISLMRLFHYYNRESDLFSGLEYRDTDLLGSSPHTDWGLLTLIIEDSGPDSRALQFFHKERKEWLDVPAVPSGIIVNGGDYLSLLSKGHYHSPVHRVLCPERSDRYSSVFFYYPGYSSALNVWGVGGDVETEQQAAADAPAVDDAAAAAAAAAVGKDAPEHNTLLVLGGGGGKSGDGTASDTILFGDYIIQKWKGVSRS
jgi:hypothetical protein